jgi:hypothetical protein
MGHTRSGLPLDEDRLRRFMSKFEETASGCWEWTAGLHKSGYGIFYGGRGTTTKAHRWGYILFRGPIPDGHYIDHLCRNIRCVNPDHLEPVTPGENTRRSQAGIYMRNRAILRLREVTECPQGHPFDDENTQWRRKGRTVPRRVCRACKKEKAKPPTRVTCSHCGGDFSSASMYRHLRRAHPEAVAA